MFHFPSFSRPPNFSLSLALSLFLSLALTENNEAQQTQHWDHRVSLLRNHICLLHLKPPRRYGGEEGGGERSGGKGEENGVGGYGVECPPCWSRLPSTDLSSPFHFFSFFLHSSLISPEFFLSFADLTWVFLLWLWVDFLGLGCCCGFYFCGCGLALRSEFLALISFFFFLVNN